MFNEPQTVRLRIVLTIAVAVLVGTTHAQPFRAGSRGPLARLIKTPDADGGLPPYALADQYGAVQRYVEPVPGIDLEPYVNQIVTVKHDTGETLLASQLELPSSLYPMVGEGFGPMGAGNGSHGARGGRLADSGVRQAEFVDNDDTTVELIEDVQPMAQESMAESAAPMAAGAVYPDGTPAFPGPPMAPGMPMGSGGGCYDPTLGGYPGQFGMAPQCEGYPAGFVSPEATGFLQPFGQSAQAPRERPHLYGELEINFMRAHVMENTFGKLSEKYAFSPRFILGFSGVGNLNGRARYWVYGRGTPGLDPDDSVHIDLDVFDLEATHRFGGSRSQIELAAGLRLASMEIEYGDGASGSDLIGITAAGDGWTPLFTVSRCCVGWTYGGRFSILAGDWSGDSEQLLNERVQDDNVLVHELYAGIGIAKCCRNIDFNARLAFEMQNWHSDVLSEAGAGDSIGFVGPGIEIGAQF